MTTYFTWTTFPLHAIPLPPSQCIDLPTTTGALFSHTAFTPPLYFTVLLVDLLHGEVWLAWWHFAWTVLVDRWVDVDYLVPIPVWVQLIVFLPFIPTHTHT